MGVRAHTTETGPIGHRFQFVAQRHKFKQCLEKRNPVREFHSNKIYALGLEGVAQAAQVDTAARRLIARAVLLPHHEERAAGTPFPAKNNVGPKRHDVEVARIELERVATVINRIQAVAVVGDGLYTVNDRANFLWTAATLLSYLPILTWRTPRPA